MQHVTEKDKVKIWDEVVACRKALVDYKMLRRPLDSSGGFLTTTLRRIFCIHGEVCAKILCSEKELLKLKDSKLTQNFYGNKTGFVRLGHILRVQ